MSAPEIRELHADDARAFLARQHVGRIAYSFQDRIDIEPISFVFEKDWIYARTSPGTKLARLLHHPWCAFEADEVHGTFDWTSVVVHGSLHVLDPEAGSDDYVRALAALTALVPGTFTKHDPAPHRSILIGVFVNEISGRMATSRSE